MMLGYGNDSQLALQRSLEIYDHVLEQDPDCSWGYYHRGALKQLANDWNGALEDFQRCGKSADARLKDHAAIHTWLVRTQRGETNAATAELLAHFSNRMSQPSPDWEVQIIRFLVNQISEQEFFAAIEKQDAEWERAEFWYYSAMKHLLEGDKVKAAECFRATRKTKTRPYVVAISSQ